MDILIRNDIIVGVQMYNHSPDCGFSSNPELAEEIRAFVPQECFTHDILVLDKFDAETLGWAELAILDVPLPGNLPEIRAKASPGAPDCL